MPRLVHLAPESASTAIRRGGIRGRSIQVLTTREQFDLTRGVFAMPVMPSFWDTDPWLGELREYRGKRMLRATVTRTRAILAEDDSGTPE